MIGAWVTSIRLCSALLATHGDEVSPDRLCRAAVIVAHVADEWPPELLAGIAYRESRFDPRVVNLSSGACGPMQTIHRPASVQRRRCKSIIADEWAGYADGVQKLRVAAAFCSRRGDRSTLCMLAGYVSGPDGVRARWYSAPRNVLREAAAIRSRMGSLAGGDA